jgi:hypothetical protein
MGGKKPQMTGKTEKKMGARNGKPKRNGKIMWSG